MKTFNKYMEMAAGLQFNHDDEIAQIYQASIEKEDYAWRTAQRMIQDGEDPITAAEVVFDAIG